MISPPVLLSLLAAALVLLSSQSVEADDASPAAAVVQTIPQELDPALEAAKRAVRRRDFEEAVRIWQEAASRGSARAQYRLAVAYRAGLGVPRDLSLAFKWINLAAQGGDTEAQFELSGLYQSGTGVAPDRTKALDWLGRAARGGHQNAQKRVDQLGSPNAFTLGSSRVGAQRDQPQRALAQAIRVDDLESAEEALVRAGVDARHRRMARSREGDLPRALQRRDGARRRRALNVRAAARGRAAFRGPATGSAGTRAGPRGPCPTASGAAASGRGCRWRCRHAGRT